MTEQKPTLREMAKELSSTMRCNCDLDNWEPECSTGHSHVCRIHKEAQERHRTWLPAPTTGETKPYGDGWHADLDFDDLVRAAAPAPSAGETVLVPSDVIRAFADFYEAFGWADKCHPFNDDYIICAATYGKKLTLGQVRSLLAAAPTTGEP